MRCGGGGKRRYYHRRRCHTLFACATSRDKVLHLAEVPHLFQCRFHAPRRHPLHREMRRHRGAWYLHIISAPRCLTNNRNQDDCLLFFEYGALRFFVALVAGRRSDLCRPKDSGPRFPLSQVQYICHHERARGREGRFLPAVIAAKTRGTSRTDDWNRTHPRLRSSSCFASMLSRPRTGWRRRKAIRRGRMDGKLGEIKPPEQHRRLRSLHRHERAGGRERRFVEAEWTESSERSNLQSNIDDCGVFNAMNGRATAKDYPFTAAVAAEMRDARRTMAAVRLAGGLRGDWESKSGTEEHLRQDVC